MTRRGFIKRIGGVAASVVAVASIPVLATHKAQVLNAREIEIWIDGIKMASMSHAHTAGVDDWYNVTALNPPKIPNDYEPITIMGF